MLTQASRWPFYSVIYCAKSLTIVNSAWCSDTLDGLDLQKFHSILLVKKVLDS